MLVFVVTWARTPVVTHTHAASSIRDGSLSRSIKGASSLRSRTNRPSWHAGGQVFRVNKSKCYCVTPISSKRVCQSASIPVIIADATPDPIAALRADPAVASVRISRLYAPVLSESATRIGARIARAVGYAGAGTSVAVLDTGVDKNYPFLVGSVVQEACFSTLLSACGGTPLCPARRNNRRVSTAACHAQSRWAAAITAPTSQGLLRVAQQSLMACA